MAAQSGIVAVKTGLEAENLQVSVYSGPRNQINNHKKARMVKTCGLFGV